LVVGGASSSPASKLSVPPAPPARDALTLKTRTLLEVTAGELARAVDGGAQVSPDECLLLRDVADLAELLLRQAAGQAPSDDQGR
jgi:hypothetical protein